MRDVAHRPLDDDPAAVNPDCSCPECLLWFEEQTADWAVEERRTS